MPIAESRMCRTPVICLDTPEMREAAENDGYFLSENNWREEIQPYILASSQIQYIDKTSYLSNKDKAFKISKTIDSLYRSSYI